MKGVKMFFKKSTVLAVALLFPVVAGAETSWKVHKELSDATISVKEGYGEYKNGFVATPVMTRMKHMAPDGTLAIESLAKIDCKEKSWALYHVKKLSAGEGWIETPEPIQLLTRQVGVIDMNGKESKNAIHESFRIHCK